MAFCPRGCSIYQINHTTGPQVHQRASNGEYRRWCHTAAAAARACFTLCGSGRNLEEFEASELLDEV